MLQQTLIVGTQVQVMCWATCNPRWRLCAARPSRKWGLSSLGQSETSGCIPALQPAQSRPRPNRQDGRRCWQALHKIQLDLTCTPWSMRALLHITDSAVLWKEQQLSSPQQGQDQIPLAHPAAHFTSPIHCFLLRQLCSEPRTCAGARFSTCAIQCGRWWGAFRGCLMASISSCTAWTAFLVVVPMLLILGMSTRGLWMDSKMSRSQTDRSSCRTRACPDLNVGCGAAPCRDVNRNRI